MSSLAAPLAAIDSVIQSRKVVITCGTGGVGKTTLSAAIAIRAAMLGRKAAVVTVDPAKRLKTSLGIDDLGHHPTPLTAQLRKACSSIGKPELRGTLDAIVPDTRKTFESYLADLAPTGESAKKVMNNPIFGIFARDFSGSNEYMALQRLYALHSSGAYDCIILDTPPSRNTLAFLDAPALLAGFFEEKLFRWLVLPANRIASAAMKKALSLMERLTGEGFMVSLFEFAGALLEMQDNFTKNLKSVTELLESERTGFLMVTAPTPDSVPEARHFIAKLKEHRMRFDGVVVNRSLSYLNGTAPADGQAHEVLKGLLEREKTVLGALNGTKLLAMLPELARDVHSLEDLFLVALAFEVPCLTQ